MVKKNYMGFAVYHVEKGKSNGVALGNHIDRTPGHEKTFKNANPELTKFNWSAPIRNDRHKMPLNEAIKDCIKEGYKGEKKIRSDAVTHLKHIMSFSHEDKERISGDLKLKKEWLQANVNFITEQFGQGNSIRFTLHMDEKTPHIHCVTVPLTKDGRLSAKEMIGNREKMQERQDRYAELMKPFGLDRGIKGSRAKHTSVDYYYGVLAKTEEKKEVNVSYPEIERPSRIGSMDEFKKNTDRTIKEHIDALKVDFDSKIRDHSIRESKNIFRENRQYDLMHEIDALRNSNEKMESSMVMSNKTIDTQEKELKRLNEGLGNWKNITKAALTGDEKAKQSILEHLFQKKKDNGRERG